MKTTTALWLSGWGMPDSVFDRLRSRLPDFRHESATLNDVRTPDEMVAEAVRSAERCRAETGSGRLLLFGWSLGSLLALRIASEGIADGLVLFGATARFVRREGETSPGCPDVIVRRMAAALSENRASEELRFLDGILTDLEKQAGYGQWLPGAGSWSDSALAAGLEYLRSEDVRPLLQRVNCPSLLVHGTDDRICFPEAGRQLADALRSASLLPVARAGHAPFLGREELTADWIRRWWDGTHG
jgi:pimeloyl-[acyl-carrier protein] methyl ester esterase